MHFQMQNIIFFHIHKIQTFLNKTQSFLLKFDCLNLLKYAFTNNHYNFVHYIFMARSVFSAYMLRPVVALSQKQILEVQFSLKLIPIYASLLLLYFASRSTICLHELLCIRLNILWKIVCTCIEMLFYSQQLPHALHSLLFTITCMPKSSPRLYFPF